MRLALVHDWLTGMRGGEKCLEVLCRRFPGAELFTLLHRQLGYRFPIYIAIMAVSRSIRFLIVALLPATFKALF